MAFLPSQETGKQDSDLVWRLRGRENKEDFSVSCPLASTARSQN